MNGGPRIGVIGIGLMGTAITERLLEHGYRVPIWNRNRGEGVPSAEALGAVWSDDPIADCDRVIVCLYSSEVVKEVIGRVEGSLRPGQIVVDTTTGDPAQTVALGERLAAKGVRYLDAPISGSSEQTRRGEATVMVGGDRSAFEACADLWPILGRRVVHVGGIGAAAKLKLASNLVLGLNRAALAEGLAFAEAIGIDPRSALEVFMDSMAYSKAMDAKGPKMIEGDFTVQARLAQHLKDVKLMLEAADAVGMAIPLAEAHARLMEQAIAAGWGDLDNSAIIKVFQRPKS
jgi:3-hydroxyisobutyrate dehydrogenase-like beta-hydroxyacid dehydrogenase